jgi:hypothetical protein
MNGLLMLFGLSLPVYEALEYSIVGLFVTSMQPEMGKKPKIINSFLCFLLVDGTLR